MILSAFQVKVPLRAGRGDTGEFGASVHSASQSRRAVSDGECPNAYLEGTDPSYDLLCAA